MNNFKYKMMEFMRGRNGTDELGVFLLILGMIVEIIGRISHISFIYYVGVGFILVMVFRMFSRNLFKRREENQKFLEIKDRIFGAKRNYREKKKGTYTYSKKERDKNGKGGVVYCYSYCPSCRQQVRVPAGKGKVKVTCPKCRKSFTMHT